MRSNLCLLCRSSKHLCGMPYCPILSRLKAQLTVLKATGCRVRELHGSSPPSVFVGRYGYPRVSAGPSAPPLTGDTGDYDAPEKWLGLSLDDVLTMRLSLINGYGVLDVRNVWCGEALKLQEVALSGNPVDVEVEFARPLRPEPTLSSEAPPSGPRGPVRRFRLASNASIPRPLSRAYYDTDLPVREAVKMLYSSGVPVSKIWKALSVGALGLGRRRRFVPTRWAITAVDSAVSKYLVGKVKELPEFGEHLLFLREHANNLFVAIVIPTQWSFEWMEAWFPGSTWNPRGLSPSLEGDWEGPGGRAEYASIGGCYYAARLATAEFMLRVGRKGAAVLYREIYPGFNIPVGVWFVRENVRALLRSKPERLSTLQEVLERLRGVTRLPLEAWVRRSAILTRFLRYGRLDKYVRGC